MPARTAAPFLLALGFLAATSAAASESLRVISLNTGAGQQGEFKAGCVQNTAIASGMHPTNVATIGVRRLLGREAVAAYEAGFDEIVFALQEIDQQTARSRGFDQAWYYTDRLAGYRAGSDWERGWNYAYLPALNLCGEQDPQICKLVEPDHARDRRCGGCQGTFGVATIGSTDLYKVKEHRFQWYPVSAFTGGGHFASGEYRDYAREPRVALATKVAIGGQPLWIVNTHLGGYVADGEPDERVAIRQIWQLLGLVGSMQPDTPILVVGDFNILKGGRHRVSDPVYASDGQRYFEMRDILLGAGFEELGDYPSDRGCWEPDIDRCTMNAWGNYSMIDYAYLFDPANNVAVDAFSVLDPTVDAQCYVTDHKGLVIDLRLSTTPFPAPKLEKTLAKKRAFSALRLEVPATADFRPSRGSDGRAH